jgi:hypothetical protein
MTDHPGLSSPRIADMRQLLESEELNDTARRRVETAIEEIETVWANRKREGYDKGVAERDRNHAELLEATNQFRELIKQRADDVRNGRWSAAEARSWLRDVRADFDKLTRWHRGIESSEERLTEVDAMTVDQFQAAQFTRFPMTAGASPTLAAKLAEDANRRTSRRTGPGLSKAQIDADQEALARGVGRHPDHDARGRREG